MRLFDASFVCEPCHHSLTCLVLLFRILAGTHNRHAAGSNSSLRSRCALAMCSCPARPMSEGLRSQLQHSNICAHGTVRCGLWLTILPLLALNQPPKLNICTVRAAAAAAAATDALSEAAATSRKSYPKASYTYTPIFTPSTSADSLCSLYCLVLPNSTPRTGQGLPGQRCSQRQRHC